MPSLHTDGPIDDLMPAELADYDADDWPGANEWERRYEWREARMVWFRDHARGGVLAEMRERVRDLYPAAMFEETER